MSDYKSCPECDGMGKQTVGNLALKGGAKLVGEIGAYMLGGALGLTLNGDGLQNSVDKSYKCQKCGCKFDENGKVSEHGSSYTLQEMLEWLNKRKRL